MPTNKEKYTSLVTRATRLRPVPERAPKRCSRIPRLLLFRDEPRHGWASSSAWRPTMAALRISRQFARCYPAPQVLKDSGIPQPFGGFPFRLTLPSARARILMKPRLYPDKTSFGSSETVAYTTRNSIKPSVDGRSKTDGRSAHNPERTTVTARVKALILRFFYSYRYR